MKHKISQIFGLSKSSQNLGSDYEPGQDARQKTAPNVSRTTIPDVIVSVPLSSSPEPRISDCSVETVKPRIYIRPITLNPEHNLSKAAAEPIDHPSVLSMGSTVGIPSITLTLSSSHEKYSVDTELPWSSEDASSQDTTRQNPPKLLIALDILELENMMGIEIAPDIAPDLEEEVASIRQKTGSRVGEQEVTTELLSRSVSLPYCRYAKESDLRRLSNDLSNEKARIARAVEAATLVRRLLAGYFGLKCAETHSKEPPDFDEQQRVSVSESKSRFERSVAKLQEFKPGPESLAQG